MNVRLAHSRVRLLSWTDVSTRRAVYNVARPVLSKTLCSRVSNGRSRRSPYSASSASSTCITTMAVVDIVDTVSARIESHYVNQLIYSEPYHEYKQGE